MGFAPLQFNTGHVRLESTLLPFVPLAYLNMAGFAYSFSAIVIFVFVTVNFLFPCNRIFPLGKCSQKCKANSHAIALYY